jgi:hypothetical protein
MKTILTISIFILSFVACETRQQKDVIARSPKSKLIKAFEINESYNQIDQSTNDTLQENLNPIRENFKKINSIKNDNWSSITTKFLEGTTEGGEVKYYRWNNNLDKIVTKEYGETFQILTEYYLLNGQLSFVFEKGLKYNRSIWKNRADKDDEEVFDIKKSEIEENRTYFENGKIIFQITKNGNALLFTEEYLKRSKTEILNNFNSLIKTEKAKE